MSLPPLITKVSRPYWDALAQSRIALQQCESCARWIFYPRNICPHCGEMRLAWKTASGRATLYTFTVAEVPVSEDFANECPLILAVAELEEGIRIPTTLVRTPVNTIKIGMPLFPVFDRERLTGITLLRFAGNHDSA